MKRKYQWLLLMISVLVLIHLTNSEPMKTVEFNETDLVSINLNAVDSDGDALTYKFSEPLDSNGEWQTDYGDYGEYLVTVSVSDGQVETSQDILLIIHKVNWPPVIEDLQDVVITETDTFEFDPIIYDEEGDKITIEVSEPVGNDMIWETGYEDAGEYSIDVKVSDGEHTVTDSFKLIVEDLNRDPNFVSLSPSEGNVKINEGEKVDFKANVIDEDNNKLVFSWLLDGEEVSSSDKYTFSPDYEMAGVYSLVLEVSDGETIIEKNWNLIVENMNRAPILDKIEDITVNEGEKIELEFNTYDPDGDEVKYKITEPVGNDKEWETTFDDSGEYLIEVIVTDGDLTNSQVVKITVLDVDRAPVFDKIEKLNVNEGEEVVISLVASDPDGDWISFSSLNLPEGAVIKGDIIEYTPDYDFVLKPNTFLTRFFNALRLDNILYKSSRTLEFEVTATGKEKSAIQKVKLKVLDIDRMPVLDISEDIIVNETEKVSLVTSAYDPDNDRLIFYASEPLGDDLKWNTGFDDAGVYDVEVNVSDGYLVDSKYVTIIVNDVNRMPLLNVVDSVKVQEGQELVIDLSTSDPDSDNLIITASDMPAGATLVGNEFRWTPGYDSSLEDVLVTFTASDGGLSVSKDLVISVSNTNRKPVLNSATGNIRVKVGEKFTLSVDITDPDGDLLNYEWKFGMFSSIKDAKPKLRRSYSSTGLKLIKLIVSDGEVSMTKTFKVLVE